MSWITEMKKGLDRMWDGLVKDKLRQEGILTDMAPKWWSVLIWIILVLLICYSPLHGQRVVRPELVPYQIVPIDLQPDDCNLEVGIRLIHPYNVENMQEPQQQETLEIIYKRIGFEVVNPHMSAGMFEIDGKLYHLIRIPYTGATESEWEWN